MISQFSHRGENVYIRIRCGVKMRAQSPSAFFSSVYRVRCLVLSLSCLCLYSCCCHLSYSCLHVTWFSKQAPIHSLFSLTNALAFSNNVSLDAMTAGTPLRTKELFVKIADFFLWRICVYLQRGQNASCVGFNRLPDDLNNSSPRVTLSSLRTGRWHLLFALQERRASSRELDQNTHQTAADMGILP